MIKFLQNLSVNILIAFLIYFLLTLPHFLAFITFDLETGEYFGYIYPLWLIMSISLVSIVVSSILGRKFHK